METTNDTDQGLRNNSNDHHAHSRSGRIWSGAALITIGAVFMAHQLGLELPHWIFSWQMILITIGVFSGARHSFRLGGWIVPILIGLAFMIDDFIPGMDIELRHFIWPAIIIGAGLLMIFRPRRRREHWNSWSNTTMSSSSNDSGEVVDIVSIFGGTKRNIISKEFKGGDAVAIFGGNDLILSQADFTGTATLDLTQIFGGTNLVVPANWKIQSEVVSIFASLEDKRPQSAEQPDSTKVLKLIGTSVFGSITIKSY